MAGNLAVARRESRVNNRALDFSPATLGAASALFSPSRGQSQIPLDMPVNGPGQRVRHVPTPGSGGDSPAAVSHKTNDSETMAATSGWAGEARAALEKLTAAGTSRGRATGQPR